MSQPPFSEWRSREPYMSQLRIDHAHSRLEHPAWAAAVIAQLKDEEVLVKRRHRPDAGTGVRANAYNLEPHRVVASDVEIIDRRPRNAAEPGPPADAPKKGRCMDDLRNFYRDFSVPLERALSMAVGPLWLAMKVSLELLMRYDLMNICSSGECSPAHRKGITVEYVLTTGPPDSPKEESEESVGVQGQPPGMNQLAYVTLAFEFRLDQCRYGTPYQKPTALLASKQVFKRVAKNVDAFIVPHGRCEPTIRLVPGECVCRDARRFTAMGGYSSVRAWASTLGEAAGQSGLRSRPGDTCHGAGKEPSAGEVCAMVAGRRGVGDALRNAGQEDPTQFSLHLEEYGRVLYEQGETRRNFAQTVNVMNQRHPFLKHFMAMVTTALAWQWMRFALMILLGYFGMLRPCEMFGLRVEDCILAAGSGCEQVVFLRLELVKTRTRGARRQSARLEEPCAVQFLQKCLKVMAPGEKLWPYSANLFRVRLRQVLQASTGRSDLCVPSSLRAGGATYYFRLWNEDLLRLQWRGRWLHMKASAHYVQELGCVNILQSIRPANRRKMQQLSDLFESACQEATPEADLVTETARLVARVRRTQLTAIALHS
ncbi:unnamed protein product [Symbiodinium microadriaticum]|nr:unnamed protein product [Symbiodinium microadriaticum]